VPHQHQQEQQRALLLLLQLLRLEGFLQYLLPVDQQQQQQCQGSLQQTGVLHTSSSSSNSNVFSQQRLALTAERVQGMTQTVRNLR
jgi:hypothetical protein